MKIIEKFLTKNTCPHCGNLTSRWSRAVLLAIVLFGADAAWRLVEHYLRGHYLMLDFR